MAYYIMIRLTIQYFKHDLRRENAKYCIGRYVRYTIKAVPHKVFSRFNPSNVETHVRYRPEEKKLNSAITGKRKPLKRLPQGWLTG